MAKKIYKRLTKRAREEFKTQEEERRAKARAFTNKVETLLSNIVSDFEEEEAAERIMNSKECLQNILDECREGVPFRLAVRNELQAEVERYEEDIHAQEYEDYQYSYFMHNVW